jgi:addiction module HigA family antidote
MIKKDLYYPATIIHPGVSLEEKLEEMGMGPKEFALRTGKPEKTIIAVLKGKSAITPDMAVQFENVTKIPADFWMRYQLGYDAFIAQKKRQKIIRQSIPWAFSFPLKEMIEKKWLPDAKNKLDRTTSVLAFFAFSDHTAWEDYYFRQQLKVAFRISLSGIKEPYAISAWLRQGEIQATALQNRDYSEKNFKGTLATLKTFMITPPGDLKSSVQNRCLEAGVKVVYTPALPKAPILGSTRWINNTPLIQLTGEFSNNDSFWFTFFHEAGHILLHGKKDIFLEQIEYSDKDKLKEDQADEFARKWITMTS